MRNLVGEPSDPREIFDRPAGRFAFIAQKEGGRLVLHATDGSALDCPAIPSTFSVLKLHHDHGQLTGAIAFFVTVSVSLASAQVNMTLIFSDGHNFSRNPRSPFHSALNLSLD
jgi:hypothetical protein